MTIPETQKDDGSNSITYNHSKSSHSSVMIKILVGAITGVITLTILLWMSFPVPYLVNKWISSQYTPTPHPPTTTLIPTKTSTVTLTPTLTSTPSPTNLPPSSHQLTDLTLLTPAVPPMTTNAIVLNENDSVTVVPDFTDIQWTHSSMISQQIGVEISEPFYATFSPGSATWVIDSPLDPGIYNLYILDTLFSSGGVLEYTVKLGDQVLTPLVGRSRLEFKSSRGNPPQRDDLWQSIGLYEITQANILSVTTSWDMRDELTIVAIDRLLIARMPDTLRNPLNSLPKDQLKFIVDDTEVEFEALQYWQIQENDSAWGNKFHLLLNPPIAIKTTWKLLERVPTGKYEIFAWIPKINGTAEINYKLLVEGSEISSTGEIPPVLTQGDEQEPHWQSIGSWQIPEVFGESVQMAVEMNIVAESIGEIAVDAIAFVKSQ